LFFVGAAFFFRGSAAVTGSTPGLKFPTYPISPVCTVCCRARSSSKEDRRRLVGFVGAAFRMRIDYDVRKAPYTCRARSFFFLTALLIFFALPQSSSFSTRGAAGMATPHQIPTRLPPTAACLRAGTAGTRSECGEICPRCSYYANRWYDFRDVWKHLEVPLMNLRTSRWLRFFFFCSDARPILALSLVRNDFSASGTAARGDLSIFSFVLPYAAATGSRLAKQFLVLVASSTS